MTTDTPEATEAHDATSPARPLGRARRSGRRITNLVVDRGEGSWLITTDGERYLDYTSGIGVTNTGHAHPRVVAAIPAQAAKLLHGQQNIVYHEPGLRLHDRLAGLLPGGRLGRVPVEQRRGGGRGGGQAGARRDRPAGDHRVPLRLPRPDRPGDGADRGEGRLPRRTSSRCPGSVYHAAYPYCYRAAGGAHDPGSVHLRLGGAARPAVPPARLPGARSRRSSSSRSSARAATSSRRPGFLPRLREITRQHGILLIADEVQTGFGRTGELFAVQHWDVEPDIIVMAKGIASGLPLSGIIASASCWTRWAPGTHGGTYGGNVVPARPRYATLDVIEDEGLVANARDRGAQFLDGLRRIAAGHPSIGDVRGLGLMLALEFDQAGRGRRPRPEPGADEARAGRGASRASCIVLTAGTYVNVVRIIPPLVTTADEVDSALAILDESLTPPAPDPERLPCVAVSNDSIQLPVAGYALQLMLPSLFERDV